MDRQKPPDHKFPFATGPWTKGQNKSQKQNHHREAVATLYHPDFGEAVNQDPFFPQSWAVLRHGRITHCSKAHGGMLPQDAGHWIYMGSTALEIDLVRQTHPRIDRQEHHQETQSRAKLLQP